MLFSLFIICLCAVLIYFTVDEVQSALSGLSDSSEITIIIDAGHGGADGGAVGCDGTPEQIINLQISQYIEYYLNSFGVKTLMTRTDENSIHNENADTIREQKVSDIHNRMEIMENTKNCLFVSIHQNSFQNSNLWGTQVFYSPNTTASPELADLIQTSVKSLLQPDNKRLVKKSGSSIYLLYYAKKPAVLVECGFITNPEELKELKSSEYQRKMAFSIAIGIVEYLNK